jgi:hypothetical protein
MNFNEELGKVEEKVEQVSFAMELLQFSKEQNVQLEHNNKRMFIIILVLIGVILASVGYNIYLLNDTATVETTEVTQDNENGYNNYVGNDGDITNGEANDKEN